MSREIAEPLDVSKSTARAYVRKIKEYAVLVAQDEFAITEDDLYTGTLHRGRWPDWLPPLCCAQAPLICGSKA